MNGKRELRRSSRDPPISARRYVVASTAVAVSCSASASETSATLERGSNGPNARSEEHTSELQSQSNLVCRLLLEKKKKTQKTPNDLRRVFIAYNKLAAAYC